MKDLFLPDEILRHVKNMQYEKNSVGRSEAGVYRFQSEIATYYLKIEPKSGELEREYRNLLWLQDKLPVPKVIEWTSGKDMNYLLISEIEGKMLCHEYYLKNPEMLVSLLAKGIQEMHSINIEACPLHNSLQVKLRDAEENIRLGRVDMEDWETGSNGFSTPQQLLEHLHSNIPEKEELVFAHGDYCLPNILANHGKIAGFIDLGRAGVADLWQDLALCIRSLEHKFKTDEYGKLLLQQLGIQLDEEKLDYYILLDELF